MPTLAEKLAAELAATVAENRVTAVDPTVFQAHEDIFENEVLRKAIIESSAHDYQRMLHNERTATAKALLGLNPAQGDFRDAWNWYQGRLQLLEILLKTN